ncbi:hypothetical protein B4N84_11780 [Flavobacterium sp. IR1]|nr:hypothetical protein B4N84_11780 [Flavobacterium sp. IR1]
MIRINSTGLKKNTIDAICLLYILLFVYAAVSKLLDFENFQIEMGQSPLLSAFANWISWIVLVVEGIIAVLLVIAQTRIIALYASFSLMVMFTAYIFIMLNFSSYVPCSCGGILQKMSWTQHLIFNSIFVLLALLALYLHHLKTKNLNIPKKAYLYWIRLLLIFASSIFTVVVLFLSSEEIMQHQNPFIRRYPHHPVTLLHTIDLKYNSYYFAGAENGTLYLGNSTVPLGLLAIDSKMAQQKIRTTLDRQSFYFKTIKMTVRPPFFYIMDGGIPVVFRGQISNWNAKLLTPNPPYFNIGVPIDSTSMVFRGISSKTNNNVIGIFRSGKQSRVTMAPQLLQKQIDGVFDTDGMLHYSPEMRRIVYLYTYRNQYIVAHENGTLDYRGHTIDTISHAKIKVAYLKEKTERAMSMPALNVNRSSSVCGHLLFVNSNVPGRYEQNKIWKQASVIDVYDLNKKAYLLSFHIYGIKDKKLRNFIVTPSYIYALIGKQLVVYQLNQKLKDELKRVEEKEF